MAFETQKPKSRFQIRNHHSKLKIKIPNSKRRFQNWKCPRWDPLGMYWACCAEVQGCCSVARVLSPSPLARSSSRSSLRPVVYTHYITLHIHYITLHSHYIHSIHTLYSLYPRTRQQKKSSLCFFLLAPSPDTIQQYNSITL